MIEGVWEKAIEQDRVEKPIRARRKQSLIEQADGWNVQTSTWECDTKSEKSRGEENKPGRIFSQCCWTEAIHCENYNRGFSDDAITSTGENSAQATPQQRLEKMHKGQLSELGNERAHAYVHIHQLETLS